MQYDYYKCVRTQFSLKAKYFDNKLNTYSKETKTRATDKD